MNGFFEWNKVSAQTKKYISGIAVAVGIWFAFRYLLPVVLPLILASAFVIPSARFLRYLSNRIHIGRHHIGKGLLTGTMLTLLVCLLFATLWLILFWLYKLFTEGIGGLDRAWDKVIDFLSVYSTRLEARLHLEEGKIISFLKENGAALYESLKKNFFPKLMSGSFQYAKGAILGITFLLVTFVSAVLLAKDYDKIKSSLITVKGIGKASAVLAKVGCWMKDFLLSQFVIMLSIATVCSVFFWGLRISHPIQIGVLTGFLDFLPFFGSGIILWPMTLWFIVEGNFVKAVVLVLLYLSCVLIRNFLEPRFMGKSVGLYPVFMLTAVYAGIYLFGFKGVILGPIAFLLWKEIWNELPSEK